MRKYVCLMFCLVFTALIISCATMQKGPTSDLEQTVRAYFELKKQGRFFESWNFERMSIEEDETKRNEWKKLYLNKEGGIPLKGYEILRIGDEGSRAGGFTPVRVKLVTDWPPLPFTAPEGDRVLEMDDLWEKIDGRWYHVKAGLTRFW